MKGHIEVADIFRVYGKNYRDAHAGKMPLRHHKAMNAIEVCRTSVLGGHKDECDTCEAIKISYNSCRNRHCPKCQCLDKERWLESRKQEVLPVNYFHVVFTKPSELSPLSLRNQAVSYSILFKASSETLKELSGDTKHLGALPGYIGILHTWSQTLTHHPHIHYIVTGGGLSPDGKKWISCKNDFFIHVKVLSRVFRGKYLYYLKKAYQEEKLVFPGLIKDLETEEAFNRLCSELYKKEWVVYCKPPFKYPEDVIDYLGRYTHRVAITNNRIEKAEDGKVTFKYRDRQDNDKVKSMSLDASEFIRRFLYHILPDGFMKIRQYGILSNRYKSKKLKICRDILGVKQGESKRGNEKESWEDLLYRLTGTDPRLCPYCKKGRMVRKQKIHPLKARSPPAG
jgi:hypothetical protein